MSGEQPESGRAKSGIRVYWDNSNIYHRTRAVAEKRGFRSADGEVRVDFQGLKRLAFAGREGLALPGGREPVIVAASTPPDNGEQVWRSMAAPGEVRILTKFDRRGRIKQNIPGEEQNVPDMKLQLEMMRDALDSLGGPGVAVLLSGDGGFLPWLKRMHAVGWGVEVLAWESGCSPRMRRWVREHAGESVVHVRLDDYFDEVTYEVTPSRDLGSRGWPREWKIIRRSARLTDAILSSRPTALPHRPEKWRGRG